MKTILPATLLLIIGCTACREGKLKGKLKEIASHLDEESNPVIMLAKYKK